MGTLIRVIVSILLLPIGFDSSAHAIDAGEVTRPIGAPHPAHPPRIAAAPHGELSHRVRDATSLRPTVTMLGATTAQEQLVTDTLDLFAAADLPLPDVVIEFADSSDGCRGHAGLFVPAANGPDHITICGRLALFLRHELAHAWARHALDDADRARLLQNWGLARWRDPGDDWGDRGTEMAAQTIAFGLGLNEATDDPNMLRYVCSYEQLTGEPAPAAVRESCQPDSSSARR